MKDCKSCFHTTCDLPDKFLGLMVKYALEENSKFDSMTLDDFVMYFENLIDEYVQYMHGHITPSVVYYVKNFLLVDFYQNNFYRKEVENV